jgi:hypothetical protein
MKAHEKNKDNHVSKSKARKKRSYPTKKYKFHQKYSTHLHYFDLEYDASLWCGPRFDLTTYAR